MGEREDILRRALETLVDCTNDDARLRPTPHGGWVAVGSYAQDALEEADACPPDDAVPRPPREEIERAHADRVIAEDKLRDAQQRLDQIVERIAKIDLHQRLRQGRGEETCEQCVKDLGDVLRLARGEAAS